MVRAASAGWKAAVLVWGHLKEAIYWPRRDFSVRLTGAEPCLVGLRFGIKGIARPIECNPVERNMDTGIAESVVDKDAGGRTIGWSDRAAPGVAGKGAGWDPGRLRCAILLGGTVRSSPFGSAIKRSLLDLPIGDSETLLGHWGKEFSRAGAELGLAKILVRVVIGRNCFSPQTLVAAQGVQLSVDRDPVEFRGTGGVLHDLAREYDDDDLLLVAVANQLSAEPLASRVRRLWEGGGRKDAALLAGPHSEPAGLFLMRCGCLRGIAASGFVDLKEQAMPGIARNHSVGVVFGESPSYSIRRWNEYLVALRHRHPAVGESDTEASGGAYWAYQEQWQPRFSVIEEDAMVDESAGVHDSVVLAGGRVEAKSVIVRSLVAPGGVVGRGQIVVDRLVTATGMSE